MRCIDLGTVSWDKTPVLIDYSSIRYVIAYYYTVDSKRKRKSATFDSTSRINDKSYLPKGYNLQQDRIICLR